MSRIRKDTEAMEPEEKAKPSNGLKWWVSPPPYVRPKDTDICGEPLEDGSGFYQKTVAEHRREFMEFAERISRRAVRF